MQDFAKYRSVENGELERPEVEWGLDPISMLFGVLLGAIVVFAWLKAKDYREIQPAIEELVGTKAVVESGIDFEFYELLKLDGLYPARQTSGIQSRN